VVSAFVVFLHGTPRKSREHSNVSGKQVLKTVNEGGQCSATRWRAMDARAPGKERNEQAAGSTSIFFFFLSEDSASAVAKTDQFSSIFCIVAARTLG